MNSADAVDSLDAATPDLTWTIFEGAGWDVPLFDQAIRDSSSESDTDQPQI